MKLWFVKQCYGADAELILFSHIKRGKTAEQGASSQTEAKQELQYYRIMIIKNS